MLEMFDDVRRDRGAAHLMLDAGASLFRQRVIRSALWDVHKHTIGVRGAMTLNSNCLAEFRKLVSARQLLIICSLGFLSGILLVLLFEPSAGLAVPR
jgi:hypothetical protein